MAFVKVRRVLGLSAERVGELPKWQEIPLIRGRWRGRPPGKCGKKNRRGGTWGSKEWWAKQDSNL